MFNRQEFIAAQWADARKEDARVQSAIAADTARKVRTLANYDKAIAVCVTVAIVAFTVAGIAAKGII